MKKLVLFTLLILTLAGCNKDGVPAIEDPDNILVDGQPMTAEAFYNEYCKLKPSNETCIAVDRADKKFKEKKAIEERLKDSKRRDSTRF